MNQSQVYAFHEKFGRGICQPFGSIPSEDEKGAVHHVATLLHEIVSQYQDLACKERNAHLYRLLGLVEEVGELADAMVSRDEVEAADAMGDICYWAIGCAVQWGWNAGAIFDEIHRSNMTKQLKDPRMREKGDSYVPPDILKVLR